MRNLKVLFISIFTLMNYNFYSQTFGVRAGLNFSNMLDKNNNVKYSEEYKVRTGFNIGATMDLPITNSLLFETGIIINTKGYRNEYYTNNNNTKVKVKYNLHYIDIPLHVKYMFNLTSFKPFVFGGPYLGFGVNGKTKTKTIIAGISTEHSDAINWGNDNDADVRVMDGGLDFGAGIEYKKFQAGLTYSLGLFNIHPVPENGEKLKNRVFSIFFAYRFVK